MSVILFKGLETFLKPSKTAPAALLPKVRTGVSLGEEVLTSHCCFPSLCEDLCHAENARTQADTRRCACVRILHGIPFVCDVVTTEKSGRIFHLGLSAFSLSFRVRRRETRARPHLLLGRETALSWGVSIRAVSGRSLQSSGPSVTEDPACSVATPGCAGQRPWWPAGSRRREPSDLAFGLLDHQPRCSHCKCVLIWNVPC